MAAFPLTFVVHHHHPLLSPLSTAHPRRICPFSSRFSPASSSVLVFPLPKCSAKFQQYYDEEEKDEDNEPKPATKLMELQTQEEENEQNRQIPRVKPTRAPESTDWIASTLTRRFGLGAGLAWVGFLAFGVISEQIKTRYEVSQEQQNTRNVEIAEEVVLPNKIKYVDLKVGGGSSPRPGDLVVIGLEGKVQSTGYVFVDTFSGSKPSLAFLFGAKPYTRGICEGLEYVIQSMKTGGQRKATIPPELGFGDVGADLGGNILIPPGATLEYVVELRRFQFHHHDVDITYRFLLIEISYKTILEVSIVLSFCSVQEFVLV